MQISSPAETQPGDSDAAARPLVANRRWAAASSEWDRGRTSTSRAVKLPARQPDDGPTELARRSLQDLLHLLSSTHNEGEGCSGAARLPVTAYENSQ